ncbi:GNAT family N-acetyltransferase, partial [Flavihumibacter sp. CACIAM 22H1]|uniref:GNAT family N-acetyltransferase n=1 Tax=Flavihumibacter sp. CACIAM 22H1 TaxID=1812911 RepID=UPI000A92B80F
MSSQAQLTQLYLHQVMPLRQEVMYPGKPVEMARVDGDETAVHLGLTVDQQIVSVVSLFVSEKYDHSLQFRKLATLLAEQGKGYGTSLLNHVLAYAE